MANGEYMKCPRCELNWIKKSQKLCDVCKLELTKGADAYNDDENDLLDEEMQLCPICKVNYIGPNEEMCEQCLADRSHKISEDEDTSDSEWNSMIDDPTDDDDTEILSLSQLEDEDDWDSEEDSFDDINNPDDKYEDDFEVVDSGDFDDYDEDDDEDEDEDEDF